MGGPDDKKDLTPRMSRHQEKKVARMAKGYAVHGTVPKPHKQTGSGIVPRSGGGFWKKLFGGDE